MVLKARGAGCAQGGSEAGFVHLVHLNGMRGDRKGGCGNSVSEPLPLSIYLTSGCESSVAALHHNIPCHAPVPQEFNSYTTLSKINISDQEDAVKSLDLEKLLMG